MIVVFVFHLLFLRKGSQNPLSEGDRWVQAYFEPDSSMRRVWKDLAPSVDRLILGYSRVG